MAELIYSADALGILSKLHRKQFVIFVEGKDDIPFWNAVFQAFGLQSFIIKAAGGSSVIERYTKAILDQDVAIYVARDSDFRELLGEQAIHPRIIWTYGHSIENTLFHPIQLAEIIMLYSREQEVDRTQVENWLSDFADKFKALLVCEVANEIYDKGIDVLGQRSARFLVGQESHEASDGLVKQQFETVRPNFSEDEFTTAESLVDAGIASKPLFFLIRGKFLTNAVINFIKKEVRERDINHKNPSLTQESLYANLILTLKSECMANPHRVDVRHLKSGVSAWTSA